jgi:hypothetical protein
MRTGEVVHPRWTLFSYQPRWHHNMVKATDYFARRLGIADPRLIEAIEHIHANPQPDGRWLLENTHPGAVHFRFENPTARQARGTP